MTLKILLLTLAVLSVQGQIVRRVGRLQEVFAWKQISFNINGNMVTRPRIGNSELQDLNLSNTRERRQTSSVVFDNNDHDERDWDQINSKINSRPRRQQNNRKFLSKRPSFSTTTTARPSTPANNATTPRPDDNAFFIQYNNLPMGVERVDNRLFVTLPRRRYGIPSTLNYLDLTQDSHTRSPGLRPYPSLRGAQELTSVYRTRADECRRLWMVDTGLLEIPNNRQQVQPPAIVVYDLTNDRQILRYPLKSTDLVSAITPTGLASITVDITNGGCGDAFAYIPDLATYGLIVYSLRDNDSWRLSHNYFSFNPNAGNLVIAQQRFQWNDGIFSITLTEPRSDGCRTAYFHAMVGTHEYSTSTCVLKNRTASSGSDFWAQFSVVGDRGANAQSTMHGYHARSNVIFFADIARDAVSCWSAASVLSPASVEILARDSAALSYPSDLHVSGDEVWVMANSLPTWAYSTLDTERYNFFIYKANVRDLISGTVCESRPSSSYGTSFRSGSDTETENNKEQPA